VSSPNRQQLRSEVRDILSFIRTMKHVREAWGDKGPRFTVKVRYTRNGVELLEAPPWLEIEHLLARFRPIYLDKERTSFRSILRILPRHVTVRPEEATTERPTFEELEKRWDARLNGTTAPIPEGTKTVGLGFEAVSDREGTKIVGLRFEGVSQREGMLEIGFDGFALTGREALELSLYGKLVHVDQAKERRRLRIEATSIQAGYRLAVISVFTELMKTADTLRIYAERFVEEFEKTLGPALLQEIESEIDPQPAVP
jgi:hypothetical protein